MTVEDVLKKTLTGHYTGFMLQTVYELTGKPINWEGHKKLKKIPHKITYFFDRSKIQEVRKTTWADKKEDNTYYLLLTDGTYLEAAY